MDDPHQELCKKFKGQGYRLTGPRAQILKVLSQSSRHLCVDGIYLAIRKKGGNVGMTTIYRAVDSLARAGIVRKMSLADGRTYYERIDKKEPGHHHHLICRKCQRVMDYSDFVNEEVSLIKKLETLVSNAHRFRIDDHQISFTGLCQSCQ